MPNYCDNRVDIMAPVKVMEEIIERLNKNNSGAPIVVGGSGDFNWSEARSFLPHETELQWNETFCPIGDYDRNAAIDNWGTKWEVSSGGYSTPQPGTDEHYKALAHPGMVCLDLCYQTAWAPNIPITEAIIEEYGDRGLTIRHRYDEPAMNFCGIVSNLFVDNEGHHEEADMTFAQYEKIRMEIFSDNDLEDLGLAEMVEKEGGYKNGDLIITDYGAGLFYFDNKEEDEASVLFQDGERVEVFFNDSGDWIGAYGDMENTQLISV